MSRWRTEVIGNSTLILGDCTEVLPTLGNADALVTDPPYGIGENNARNLSRARGGRATDYGHFEWDQGTAPEALQLAISRSRHAIVFGGNYYALPQQLPKDAKTILDPFMGSGTTGVAATHLGLTFTGIEREAAYFDAACRRVEEAWKQPRLFDEPPPPPTQGALGL